MLKNLKRRNSISQFRCEICGKVFPRKTNLRRHVIANCEKLVTNLKDQKCGKPRKIIQCWIGFANNKTTYSKRLEAPLKSSLEKPLKSRLCDKANTILTTPLDGKCKKPGPGSYAHSDRASSIYQVAKKYLTSNYLVFGRGDLCRFLIKLILNSFWNQFEIIN